jgi:hypothetical protein
MKKYYITILLTDLLFLTIISQVKTIEENLGNIEIIETNH